MSRYRFLPELSPEALAARQAEGLNWTCRHAFAGNPVYRERLAASGYEPGQELTLNDLARLPVTTVEDLRQGYPLPLLSVPEEDVVRIHASSGTTGKRKILAYTQRDIDTWKDMFARCYELAGLTPRDRVQITVGYGLWTAGAGFQLGCERFGAMAVPVGPGNMEIHLQLLEDLGATCLCSTASMALLLAEEVHKRDLRKRIKLKKVIFGAETHTDKMRRRFEQWLGIEESYDITGMTELYGPGSGLECAAHDGIHYWADLFILEVLDPVTLAPVAPGEVGEMVVTSLCKEAAPLIRYRTRDLTRLLPDPCPCGLSLPRHDRILGRSDDMFVFRGVNIYPGQIAAVLDGFKDVDSEFQIRLLRHDGRDQMVVKVERRPAAGADLDQNLSEAISIELRKHLFVRGWVEILAPGSLPRSCGKTRRVIDDRNGIED
ncbi:Phenylacetate--CoA ligase [Solidesulfovibrio carbinoliphilus subsp. oakridgensis]|uniref:Phenylacetate-coenzyme A ligase n=1 Tax=Solidesulfovibrio carbinoliphilus subsp. oakridgensis TaxID=694327 RepID=G7Q8H4_9BACT|nr:phenylacetate--CoA ligase [Solidesulfovibrio carbinoliphilus]EHJ48586.1 Phenylacetate--CoA ligase [Solidesulfovibrio carbinoliphilus subsp. oakridgensis]